MSHVSVQTVEYPATPAGNGSFRLSELRVDNSRRLPFTAGGWCIFVARSGGGEFMEPLRSYPFCEKEVVILRPGARCVIGVSDSPELVADFFHFHPEELVGLLHL